MHHDTFVKQHRNALLVCGTVSGRIQMIFSGSARFVKYSCFFLQLVNLCLSLKTECFVSFQLVKKFIIRNHQNENSSLGPNKKAMDPQPSSIFYYIVYKMMGTLSVIFIPVQDIYLDFPYINPRLIPQGGFHISSKSPLLQGFLVYMLFTYIIWQRDVLGSSAAQHQGFSSNNDFPETGCCRNFKLKKMYAELCTVYTVQYIRGNYTVIFRCM